MLSGGKSRSPAAVPACIYMDVAPRARSPTEVGQLQLPSVVDEQVLRFQVPVEDFPLVAVGETSQQLEHEDLEDKQTNKQTGITHVWRNLGPSRAPPRHVTPTRS